MLRRGSRGAWCLVLAVSLLAAPAVEAGYGVTVLDCRSGRPIPGALVTATTADEAPGRPRRVETNGDGHAELLPAPAGREHGFTIAARGYQSRTRTVFVAADRVARESVCLEPIHAHDPIGGPRHEARPASPADRAREADARARGLIDEPRAPAVPFGTPDSGEADRAIGRLGRLLGTPSPPGPPGGGLSVADDCDDAAPGRSMRPPIPGVVLAQDAGGSVKKRDLVTDAGSTVERTVGPGRPGNDRQNAADRTKYGAAPGMVFAEPYSGVNCAGYTFDRGRSEIDTPQIPTILKDNYAEVKVRECARARVCDIVAYHPAGDATTYDHVAFVAAIDANGKPTLVIGKLGPTRVVAAHPPNAYAPDWQVHRRKAAALPKATSDRIGELEQRYDNELREREAGRSDDRKVYERLIELCQARNALAER